MHWKVSAVLYISWHLQFVGVASNAASEANGKFAMKLSTTLGLEQPRENIAIAPLHLQTALALLYYGAASETAQALRQALELQNFATPLQALSQLQELVNAAQVAAAATAGHTFHTVNAFYTQERYTYNFREEFVYKAQLLHTLASRLDFGGQAKAALHINNDLLRHTNYTIGELYTPMLHGVATPFLLISAAVFKAPWAQAFDTQATQQLNFHSDAHTHKLVDMMFISHQFKYAELKHLAAQAIELPFAGSHLSLLILLPQQVDGLAALEAKLKNEDLAALTQQLSLQKVSLTLPKFRLDMQTALKPALTQLGLIELFSNAADLPQVFSTLLARKAPHLTSVTQKSLFEIDETGVAAVTGGFSFGQLFKRATQLFVNHPFYYAVRSNNAVLLAGHVVNL